MKRTAVALAIVATFTAVGPGAQAFPEYTGYSGAPGSYGQCAASCHGSGGGTIQISDFPTEYVPGQVYTVTISHNGGSTIRQFNGSCRIGAGAANAGVISAGANTAIYNEPVETNGVHLNAVGLNSATFNWTAPAAGTGTVRLYIAGHQGSYSGPNTNLTLLATEQVTDVPASEQGIVGALTVAAYPNPFTTSTTITYALAEASPVLIRIFDMAGRALESFSSAKPAGTHQFTWNAAPNPSGIYFVRVESGTLSETRALLLTK